VDAERECDRSFNTVLRNKPAETTLKTSLKLTVLHCINQRIETAVQEHGYDAEMIEAAAKIVMHPEIVEEEIYLVARVTQHETTENDE
jgi:hypothetical protein